MKKAYIRVALTSLLGAFVIGGWGLLLADWGREEALPPGNLIRLHIIANSDSTGDQQLKYQVRDAVSAYLAPRLAGVSSVDGARQVIAGNRAEILQLARQTAAGAGADYPVSMETGWFDFPLRSYGTLILPPGRYEAVRILLGAAEGKNWWCVLFPPLCFIDGTIALAQPAAAGVREAAGEAGPAVEVRWKVAELFDR